MGASEWVALAGALDVRCGLHGAFRLTVLVDLLSCVAAPGDVAQDPRIPEFPGPHARDPGPRPHAAGALALVLRHLNDRQESDRNRADRTSGRRARHSLEG